MRLDRLFTAGQHYFPPTTMHVKRVRGLHGFELENFRKYLHMQLIALCVCASTILVQKAAHIRSCGVRRRKHIKKRNQIISAHPQSEE